MLCHLLREIKMKMYCQISSKDNPVEKFLQLRLLTDLGFKEYIVNINETQGVHDLILKFKCKDTDKSFAAFATLEFLNRK